MTREAEPELDLRPPRGPRRLRLGVAGLGRAFMLMLPSLAHHPRIQLVACADPRPEARIRFTADFDASAHADFGALCEDPQVEAIYLATPHQFHAAQVARAADAGKHVLVEKPLAVTLAEAASMVERARAAGVRLVVGHSHGQDGPVQAARRMIAGGEFGAVRMISALNYTDFIYRPRRPEELDTTQGGGVVFSQGAHQVDVVRLLGGGLVRSVRAATGAWDPARPTEGAYTAFLTFENGCAASLTYSGYGRFDSDVFLDWVGEMGQPKDSSRHGAARAALAGVPDAAAEAALKLTRTYGAPGQPPGPPPAEPPRFHNQFGLVIASCDRADLRLTAQGVEIHGDATRLLRKTPLPAVPRGEVLDELCAAVLDGTPPLHDGAWGMATLEVCLAILQSAREGREVALHHQVAPKDD
ncbi:Gfo/Idh/MocA family protein [Falsiroseomonas sp.]|uniref:Gfo/Idh/MocA family protein n=1 Tax=Falsiroseomonas sp. TaxID=2870721 RepID=UPI003F705C2F